MTADEILATIPERELDAFARAFARLLISADEREGRQTETAPDPPEPTVRPLRKRSPKRLAKWEAHWQAEHDAEAES